MLNITQKKVIVGMSGGVDSSVSAWLLQQRGYLVEGLFMKNWEGHSKKECCVAAKDLADAQSVCNHLKIKLHTVSFATEYWNHVFSHLLSEYKAGRTPNPDILCNKKIKFKAFLEFAIQNLNADFIATGHYVRCSKLNGNIQLLRGLDNNKDQSYFLHTLSDAQLKYCKFPIGNLTKQEVRQIATKLGLVTAGKKDSTGICFIGKKKFRDFISRYLPAQPGLIVSVDGQKIGRHHGSIYYTLGQRNGLNIGGIRDRSGDPWYVVDKDIIKNLLIVAQGRNNPKLMSTSLITERPYWVDRQPLMKELRCTVKVRYRQQDISCLVIPLPNKGLLVNFDSPVAAVTPGQSAVFYLKERCLGGGIIKNRHPIATNYLY